MILNIILYIYIYIYLKRVQMNDIYHSSLMPELSILKTCSMQYPKCISCDLLSQQMMERLYLYNLYKSAFIVKLLTKPDLYHICGCVASENVASEIMACMQKKKDSLLSSPGC